MNHRTIYLAVALSFIALFPPRLASQETRNTNQKRETVARKVKRPSRKGAGPAAQRSYHTIGKSSSAPSINETETRVNEAEAAERFMQLKAQVIADLIRLEDGRNAEPIQDNVYTPPSDSYYGGCFNGSCGNHFNESRAQIKSDAPLAASNSAAGSNNK